jgi:hypothetical protein
LSWKLKKKQKNKIMNLNKFTKAELINRFKKLESRNTPINKSRIIELILAIKSLLIKLTLISLLIKIFKKYTFIQKILRFINWIIITIFGISVIDTFGLGFMINFLKEIRLITSNIVTYLSETQFYSFIASLFSSKENVTSPTKVSLRDGPMIEENGWETKRKEKGKLIGSLKGKC